MALVEKWVRHTVRVAVSGSALSTCACAVLSFCTAVGELLGCAGRLLSIARRVLSAARGVLSAARGVLGDTVCVVMVLCVLAFNIREFLV